MSSPSLQPATGSSNTLRSVGALLAGLLAGAFLSLATDLLMTAIGVLPGLGKPAGDKALLIATVYRTVFGIAGAYITALLAPNRPMAHAMILGVVGLIVSIAGAVFTWNHQPPLGPHWYPVALIVLAIPTAWIGGKLRVSQTQ
jgi:hypothetical protein